MNYVKGTLITLVDRIITKRIRVQTKPYCDINHNSKKKNKLENEKNTVINCFSDESTLSSKADIDEVTNVHCDKNMNQTFQARGCILMI